MRLTRKRQGLFGRLQTLETLHADLEDRIAVESIRPLPDTLRIQKMKRLRLRAKDEIAAIAGVLRTVSRPPLPEAA
ncbi:MAG: YdcH family protein [Pseudomonadota bacterium]